MKSLLLFISLLMANLVMAAETYHGNFHIENRFGLKTNVAFTYSLNLSDKQKITGDLNITGGKGTCFRDYKLASGFIRGENVELVTEALEGDCGPFTFRGKVEGDSIVGTVRFAGQPREISLRH
jgi:hypothetical protein